MVVREQSVSLEVDNMWTIFRRKRGVPRQHITLPDSGRIKVHGESNYQRALLIAARGGGRCRLD